MTGIENIINHAVVPVVGWTLIHSLWQSFIVYLLVLALMRAIPLRHSHVRYSISLGGLALTISLVIATFFYSLPDITHNPYIRTDTVQAHIWTAPGYDTITGNVTSVLEENLPIVVSLWLAGIFFFSLRLAGSWWYIQRLRHQALLTGSEWQDRLTQFSERLQMRGSVILAESSRITTPLVVGYLKPMILLPMGILSGLSTIEIESILIHELIHIRRRDYLINLIQLVVETILFFNPFVWLLSSIIRREREYCCDDAVVRYHGNARNYAMTLAKLEEYQLSAPLMTTAFAKNKNQLLKRIKRFMEKSINNQPAWSKLTPYALLILGLVCASWLSFNTEPQSSFDSDNIAVLEDTVKKKTEQRASYTRKKITTRDENGQLHEKLTEEFEGDEDLRPVITFDYSIDAIPPIPDFHFDHDVFGGNFVVPPTAFDFSFNTTLEPFSFSLDSPVYHEHIQRALEEAQLALELKQDELEEIMVKLELTMKDRFVDQQKLEIELQEKLEHKNEVLIAKMKDLERIQEEHIQKKMEEVQRTHEINMEELHEKMKLMEERMHVFEEKLKEELIKDGYIKKNDAINNIKVESGGNITINGKPIKESDRKKYSEILEKMEDWGMPE